MVHSTTTWVLCLLSLLCTCDGFQTRELSSGYQIPTLAFGSGSLWRSRYVTHQKDRPLDFHLIGIIKTALEKGEETCIRSKVRGIRHIDCAETYKTELEVGQAIKEFMQDCNVTREELFITTKVLESMKRGHVEYGRVFLTLQLTKSHQSISKKIGT
jgi:diketogulonate reductase-like aldo/keto reductase